MSMTAQDTVDTPRPSLVAVPPHGGARSGFLRRCEELGVAPGGVKQLGGLRVDVDTYDVSLDGQPAELSPRQLELLAVFLSAPTRVWSRDQLHWICWGDTSPSRRVDVQLCRIRGKLGLDLFRNIRDRGWTLRSA
jgi:DNA-binding response OmpR family regulator